ncbi:unnamed protein product, partial [Choristocarpus tenellus]
EGQHNHGSKGRQGETPQRPATQPHSELNQVREVDTEFEVEDLGGNITNNDIHLPSHAVSAGGVILLHYNQSMVISG